MRVLDRTPAAVAELLRAAHRRAASTAWRDRVGLYLVRLTEDSGLALALAVQKRTGGPDPAELLERALGMGANEPWMTASAPVEKLVDALDDLDVLREADRRLLGWAVRELHLADEVPVLVVLDGTAVATSLSEFAASRDDASPSAWFPPTVGEA